MNGQETEGLRLARHYNEAKAAHKAARHVRDEAAKALNDALIADIRARRALNAWARRDDEVGS